MKKSAGFFRARPISLNAYTSLGLLGFPHEVHLRSSRCRTLPPLGARAASVSVVRAFAPFQTSMLMTFRSSRSIAWTLSIGWVILLLTPPPTTRYNGYRARVQRESGSLEPFMPHGIRPCGDHGHELEHRTGPLLTMAMVRACDPFHHSDEVVVAVPFLCLGVDSVCSFTPLSMRTSAF